MKQRILCYPIHAATRDGKRQILLQLLRAGADLETVDSEVLTPLALSVSREDINMVQILFGAGAKTSIQVGNFRLTALEYAARKRNERLVRILLAAGAGNERSRSDSPQASRKREHDSGNAKDADNSSALYRATAAAAADIATSKAARRAALSMPISHFPSPPGSPKSSTTSELHFPHTHLGFRKVLCADQYRHHCDVSI